MGEETSNANNMVRQRVVDRDVGNMRGKERDTEKSD